MHPGMRVLIVEPGK